jgi:hypothetical protein
MRLLERCREAIRSGRFAALRAEVAAVCDERIA